MSADIEAVILTGGASRRMGTDKASLNINGVPQAERMVGALTNSGYSVTVIGRAPIEGAQFIQDASEFPGPLVALSAFQPKSEKVMILSCDIPYFESEIVEFLDQCLGEDFDAAIPEIGCRLQPLLGLYRVQCFAMLNRLVASGERKMMSWVDSLQMQVITEKEITSAGIDLQSLRSVNTPEELLQLSSKDHG